MQSSLEELLSFMYLIWNLNNEALLATLLWWLGPLDSGDYVNYLKVQERVMLLLGPNHQRCVASGASLFKFHIKYIKLNNSSKELCILIGLD